MAVVAPTITRVDANSIKVVWAALANGDTGSPVTYPDFADRTVQITGTFGAGGSVSIQGSNDGTNYATLTDPLGNALTFTGAGLNQVGDMVQDMRPDVTAGDGTTALTVTTYLRRTR